MGSKFHNQKISKHIFSWIYAQIKKKKEMHSWIWKNNEKKKWLKICCATQDAFNTIKTNIVIHMKTCTQIKKLTNKMQESIFKNTKNTSLFFKCALESQRQNMRMWTQQHGNKPPKHQNKITLNWVPAMNNKLQEINVLQQILVAIMHYKIGTQHSETNKFIHMKTFTQIALLVG